MKNCNRAFVDGQNLHMGTLSADPPWEISLERFYVYLREKYKIEKAFYYLRYRDGRFEKLYNAVEKAGFILRFKKHQSDFSSKKKGNVDINIVLDILVSLCINEIPGKVIIVSGDGDHKELVDFLIARKRFLKMLFPNKKFASSLYKKLGTEYFDYLEKVRGSIAR